MRVVTLDFTQLPASQTREPLQKRILEIAQNYIISYRRLGITVDGASNMPKCCDLLVSVV